MSSSPLSRPPTSTNERKIERLSPDITIFHPIAGHIEEHVDDPALVLLFGWMDAAVSPLQKYVEGHMSMFPAAIVVVVRIYATFFFKSLKVREAALQPLLDYLTGQLYDPKKMPSGGLLIHTLSNGGVFQLMVLHGMLRRRFLQTSREALFEFPVALVVDSAPGDNQYASMLSSFTVSLRNPVVRLVTKFSLSLAYIFYATITAIFGVDFFGDLRAFLVKPDILLAANRDTPRLYFYSEEDQMVHYKAVEAHLNQINGLGYKTRVEKFVESQHVLHARNDSDRYWSAVRATWSEALKCCTHARL